MFTLKQQAINFLELDKGNWPATCREAELKYEWVAKLYQGKIADPGATKLERLIEVLSKKYPDIPKAVSASSNVN